MLDDAVGRRRRTRGSCLRGAANAASVVSDRRRGLRAERRPQNAGDGRDHQKPSSHLHAIQFRHASFIGGQIPQLELRYPREAGRGGVVRAQRLGRGRGGWLDHATLGTNHHAYEAVAESGYFPAPRALVELVDGEPAAQ